MGKTVREEARDVPVLAEVEVLVAGGGVSGCAAAVSAARAGAHTMLLERNGCLGGVATASLMASIGNYYLLGNNEQVIHGFAGELADRLVEAGAASPRWRDHLVPGVVMDSERLKVLLADMLEEAGANVLTHALAVRPAMEGTAVRGAFFESKSGRQAIVAKTVVDATGEADLAYQAGARCRFLQANWLASTVYKMANVDVDAFVEYLEQDPESFPAGQDHVWDLETFVRNWRERGILFFPHGGGDCVPAVKQAVAEGRFRTVDGPAWNLERFGMYGLRGTGFLAINTGLYAIEELDVSKLSTYELHAQKMAYYTADFLVENVPGFANARVAHIGVDLGIRLSRYIEGRATLETKAVYGPKEPFYSDEVVGVIPASGKRPGKQANFLDFTYDVPFGVTVPVGCEYLLVGSGKSVSTDGPGILRGMTRCMICGQAAGVASALAAQQEIPPAEVPIRELQRALLKQNVFLGGLERLQALRL